jgi:hypothetical protein
MVRDRLPAMAKFNDFIEAVTDEQLTELTTKVATADQKERIAELKEIFTTPGITLALGAGVSTDAGVPRWTELLSNLVVKTLAANAGADEKSAEVLAKVYGPTLPSSVLVQARYLKKLLGDSFLEAVRSEIYSKAKKPSDMILLRSIAKVCVPRESIPGGVKEIITYNFDRLLEHILDEQGRAFTVIDRDTFPKKSDLPVRHVHGYLGKVKTDGEWVVFSEDEYHK